MRQTEDEYQVDDLSDLAAQLDEHGILADWAGSENVLEHDGSAFAVFQERAFEFLYRHAVRAGVRPEGRRRNWVTLSCDGDGADAGALGRLEAILSHPDAGRVVVSVLIHEPSALPDGILALAEREYAFQLDHCEPSTPAVRKCREIKRLCQAAVRDRGVDVVLLMLQNVFGPGIDLFGELSFADLVRQVRGGEVIKADAADAGHETSYVYWTDAVLFAVSASVFGKSGNVYNVAGVRMSRLELKALVHRAFGGKVGFEAKVPARVSVSRHSLDPLKLLSAFACWCNLRAGYERQTVSFFTESQRQKLEERVYRTVSSELGLPYDMSRKLGTYAGKLGLIREQELRMLRLVDDICTKNGIAYFLAGGSLLGAVRHRAMIPWDDDLDIGMLRKDFEKFRRVCPGLVPETHTYESPFVSRENAPHYHFDKIRLRGTFFSTRFSAHFLMNDGIFLDIIVYDQTSDVRFVAWCQILLLWMWAGIISNRWWNRPLRKRNHPWFWALMMPVFRLFPLGCFHWAFERIARFFEHKRKARYLIDGVGQNIRKGPFPREWLARTTRMDFDGFSAPVPVGYDGYLRHFYGPHYMEWLPIEKRVSGHNLARIDLGAFAFGGDGSDSRELDIRGELYERSVAADGEKTT